MTGPSWHVGPVGCPAGRIARSTCVRASVDQRIRSAPGGSVQRRWLVHLGDRRGHGRTRAVHAARPASPWRPRCRGRAPRPPRPGLPRTFEITAVLLTRTMPPTHTPRIAVGARRASRAANGATIAPPTTRPEDRQPRHPGVPGAEQEPRRGGHRHEELSGIDRPDHAMRLVPGEREQRRRRHRAPTAAARGIHESTDQPDRPEVPRACADLREQVPAEAEARDDHQAQQEQDAGHPQPSGVGGHRREDHRPDEARRSRRAPR